MQANFAVLCFAGTGFLFHVHKLPFLFRWLLAVTSDRTNWSTPFCLLHLRFFVFLRRFTANLVILPAFSLLLDLKWAYYNRAFGPCLMQKFDTDEGNSEFGLEKPLDVNRVWGHLMIGNCFSTAVTVTF